MIKGLSESKRSIHSTRIDVIAGDPVPIKAVDVVPINAVTRPNVEDIEYMPDTVPELAAAMSALARLVPPGEVSSLYIAVRDLISSIVSIDTTSLDLLQEGAYSYMSRNLEGEVAEVLTIIKQQMVFLRQQDPDKFERRRAILNDFAMRLKSATQMLALPDSPTRTSEPLPAKGERQKIIRRVSELVLQFNRTLRDDEERAERETALSSTQRKKLQVADTDDAVIDDANISQIEKAYDRRVVELSAVGDSFDMQVANSVARRREDVLGFLRTQIGQDVRMETVSPTRVVTFKLKARQTFTQLAEFVINNTDFAGFEFDILPRRRTAGQGIDVGTYDIEMRPFFAPGTLRTVITTGEVNYTIEGTKIQSAGNVHVFRRFVQKFDGREVEVRPEVFVDVQEIRRDFVLAAADNMRARNIRDAESLAERFFEQNKKYIVMEALSPEGVIATSESARTRILRKITGEKTPLTRAQKNALDLAREKIDDVIADDRNQISLRDIDPDSSKKAARLRDTAVLGQLNHYQESRAVEFRESVRRLIELSSLGMTATDMAISLPRDSDAVLTGTEEDRQRERKKLDECHASIAREVSKFSEAAALSFDAVSSFNADELARRKIASPDRTIIDEQAIARARARIDELASRARAVTVDDESVRDIAEALLGVADDAIAYSGGFRDDIDALARRDRPEANRLRTAIDDLRRKTNALSGKAKARGLTSQALVDFAASIAQSMPSGFNINAAVADLRSTAGVSSLADAVGKAVDEATNTRLVALRIPIRKLTQLTQDDRESILPYVLSVRRVVKEIGADRSALVGSRENDGTAFSRFGVTAGAQSAPVFIQESRISTLRESRDLQVNNILVISNEDADALYNMSPGTARQITRYAESNPQAAVDDLSMVTESLAASVKERVSGCFLASATSLQVLRGIVLLACILDESSERGAAGDLSDLLAEILQAGARGTTVNLAALRVGVHMRYSIGVDPVEVGVGFFVDSSQRPAARVFGQLAEGSTADEVVSGYSFLDKTLATQFADTCYSVREELNGVFAKQFKDHAVMGEIADSEIRRYLVSLMQAEAARINRQTTVPTAEEQDLLFSIKKGDTAEFKQRQEKIIADPDSTPLMCAAAKAALNFVELNGKIPTGRVPYYTPVKVNADVDEETGQPLLKRSQDFVRRSLLLSDTMPNIPSYTGQLNKSDKASFIRDIITLVDQHVLTQVFDTQGRHIRKLDINTSEKSQEFLSRLADDQMTNTLSLASAVRGPALISGQQVLTLVPLLRNGVSSEDARAAIESSNSFLIRMMIKAGEEGGYITSELVDKIKGGRIDSALVRQVSRNPDEFLKPAARYILDEVADHITELAAKYGVIATEVDEKGDVTEYSTVGDVRDAETRKAAEAVISKIAERHYESIGLSSPIKLTYSEQTGRPTFPPSPTEFFNENGLKTSMVISDPYAFIIRSVRMAQEYRDMMRQSYGLDVQDEGRKVTLIREFDSLFPGALDEAEKKAVEKGTVRRGAALDEVVSLQSEMPAKVTMDTSTMRVVDVPGGTPKEQAQRLTDTALDILNRVLRALSQPIFENRLREERSEIDRATNAINTMRSRTGMMRDDTDVFPVVLMRDFNRFVDITSEILSRAVDQTNTLRLLTAQEDIDIFLSERVEAELNILIELEKKKDFSKYSPTRIQSLKSKMQTLLEVLLPAADTEKMRRRKEFMQTGTIKPRAGMGIGGASANVLDQLTDEWKQIKQNMTTARESAQKISSDLTSRIDMQIRAMTKRGVKVAASLTGKKYDDQPIILDSVRQLESYKQELMSKRMLQLRAAGVKEDELERAASNYISRALSGVIFGVRMSRE